MLRQCVCFIFARHLPREIQLIVGLGASFYLPIVLFPSFTVQVLKFRSGVFPSLHDPNSFVPLRKALDTATMLFPASFWGVSVIGPLFEMLPCYFLTCFAPKAAVTSLFAGSIAAIIVRYIIAGFENICLNRLGRRSPTHSLFLLFSGRCKQVLFIVSDVGGNFGPVIVGFVLGFLSVLIIRLAALLTLRGILFKNFYRKNVAGANLLYVVCNSHVDSPAYNHSTTLGVVTFSSLTLFGCSALACC